MVKLVMVKKPSKTSTEARSIPPNGKSGFAPIGPITSPSVSVMLKRTASGLGLGLSVSSHTVSSLPLLKVGILSSSPSRLDVLWMPPDPNDSIVRASDR
ncbi:hypothetical protein [Mesorhizobium sp. M4A.F.Ca.ET.090.04.2.1]|uniref:hypothetical protein n=1 Tax=Mesorhizobium sp. M4A.F.Ca.ET.090.04.2.1 TaxID=2496663 RepID=UPI001FE0D4C9|nr:hypothetical protein [Mesorhizobium sp. M4A.F.Ca.ET.090.04.2.1]